mgnify:CR=1 FL=1
MRRKVPWRYALSGLLLIIAISCKTKSEEQTIQIENETPVVELAYRAEAQLGEGPIWNAKTQELYWVDILGKQLHIYSPEKNENPKSSSCATLFFLKQKSTIYFHYRILMSFL